MAREKTKMPSKFRTDSLPTAQLSKGITHSYELGIDLFIIISNRRLLHEATNDIELEFKEEKVAKYKTSSSNSWSKNKGGAQTSSGWNKGSDVKKPYEKKPFEGTTPKYPPRDKGITDPTKFPKVKKGSKKKVVKKILKKRMSLKMEKMSNQTFVSKKERVLLLYMCGSCANIASTALVEFLKLPTTKHATPYKLQWLTCHVLLGRPWQHDRSTKHDGRTNKYSLVLNDHKYVLHHMTHSQVNDIYQMMSESREKKKCEEEHVEAESQEEEEWRKLKVKAQVLLSNYKEIREEIESESSLILITHRDHVLQTNKSHSSLPNSISFLLQGYEDVFPKELPSGLPPLRGIEHQIDFVPGSQLPNKPAYRSNLEDTKKLQWQVEELLNKAINKITVKYRHPIPRLDDMLDELNGSCVFSKIDLRSGYHQIQMNPSDEWKIAFKTKFGLYEWLVMPFGLTNAPSTFMRLMNHVMKSFIGKYVVVYFDDILIYSKTMHDHVEHLRCVFDVLRKEQLYANLDKCSFYVDEVVFLGFVVNSRGFEVDESKIKAIKNWQILKSISDVRAFMGWLVFINDLALGNWQHYLWPKEFVIRTDHESLKHIRAQGKLNKRHAKWIEFLETFSYVIQYKKGKLCEERWMRNRFSTPYSKFDGFLFKGKRLCVPVSSRRELFVREAHNGGLMGQFGIKKTRGILEEQFYWPKMHKDVVRICGQCVECRCAKSRLIPHALYTPFPTPQRPWLDISMDFVLGLPRTKKASLFVEHVVKLHGIPQTILLFSTSCHPQTDGQTKVVNRTLDYMLRAVMQGKLASWEEHLPLVEFAYNQVIHNGSKRAKAMRRLHERVRQNLEKKNQDVAKRANQGRKRIMFEPGDWVWVHFRKESFPTHRKTKLMPRGDGSFPVIEGLNDNAYKVVLPPKYQLHNTFKVCDLSPFPTVGDDDPSNLRTNSFQEGENDAIRISSRPFTRS
ncbi:hypothetical protein KY285_016048 [Solanum tuberosum]|nr:hypothetical protein KY285_016048 [Solanum tuberosum]